MAASACHPVCEVPEKKKRKRRPQSHPECPACAERARPRHTMPLDHAVQTVEAIMIQRLDDRLERVERIVLDVAADYLEEEGHARTIAIRVIQELQDALFPGAFDDGPQYVPDPAGRMCVPDNPLGLVPRRSTTCILARHLLKGRESPAAALTVATKDTGGNRVVAPVFTDADLAELGRRQELRGSRAVPA